MKSQMIKFLKESKQEIKKVYHADGETSVDEMKDGVVYGLSSNVFLSEQNIKSWVDYMNKKYPAKKKASKKKEVDNTLDLKTEPKEK